MKKEPEFPHLAKLGQRYRTVAVLFLNTILFFIVLNLIAYPFVRLLSRTETAGALSHGMEKLRQVYPGYSDDEIRQLLEETWGREYVYEPFTQFKEGLIEGDYVNTNMAGFRHIAEQAAWPIDDDAFNIFVFGGSTTFGYGVPDNDTIPSHLQAALRLKGSCERPINVYNFGRANYYSTQERLLFEQVLASGIKPDVALFIDGLNEFFHLENEPKFTGQLSYFMVEGDLQLAWRAAKTIPILAVLKEMRSQFGDSTEVAPTAVPEEKLEAVVDRYLMNKRLIENLADEFGIQAFFVFQPVPTYNYNTENDVFYDDESAFGGHINSVEGYPLMAEKIESGEIGLDGDSFLWLGDLQVGRTDPLYVDRVHYTGDFSRIIADAIVNFVRISCS